MAFVAALVPCRVASGIKPRGFGGVTYGVWCLGLFTFRAAFAYEVAFSVSECWRISSSRIWGSQGLFATSQPHHPSVTTNPKPSR